MSQDPQIVDQVECVVHNRYELGEGTLYSSTNKRYYHVDIYGRPNRFPAFYEHDLVTNSVREYPVPSFVGTVAICEGGKSVVAALRDGPVIIDLSTGDVIKKLPVPATHTPALRFNDGKAGPDRRFYAGTMGYPMIPKTGFFYVFDHDGSSRVLLENISISNGLCWTSDNKQMYYIDTPDDCVYVFDFDIDLGSISNQRVAFKIPEGTGHPDGMTIDADGNLWVAQWGGSRVVCYSPTGQILRIIMLPTTNVSDVAFGGENLDEIYITTAQEHMTETERLQQPLAGNVFVVRNLGVRGVKDFEYRCTF
jgi:sugar lactone lactonase YvrE